MTLVLNSNYINTNNAFKKCGEIKTRGKSEFFLVCAFCESVFLKLDNFVMHIGQQHLNVYDEINIKNDLNTATTKKIGWSEKKMKGKCKRRTVAETRRSGDSTTKQIKVELTNSLKEGKSVDPLAAVYSDVEEQPIELIIENVEATEFEEEDDESKDPFMDNEYENDLICSEKEQSEIKCDSDVSNDVKTALQQNLVGDEDDITIALIAEFEKHPLLWSKQHHTTQSKVKRVEALQHIANNLNLQFNTDLEWKIVSDQIKNLRKKFRSEVQNQKEAASKGKSFTPTWYADRLKFLNTVLEHNQLRMQNAKLYKKTKSVLPFSNMTDAQNIKLINIYKSFRCLWDLQHIAYRFKNRRQEALCDMQKKVKDELGLNLTQVQLQKKISSIRYACSQEKQRKIECTRVEESFKPTSPYNEHITFLEDNVGPFKCAVCEKLFNAADQYQIHKSSHDGSMPFSCPICNRGFTKVGNCTVHLRRHTRDYQFECETCKKRFATSTDMLVHMRRHTGEKPYFCEICGQSFRTWTFFDSHMRRHQKRAMHKCSICSRAFYESGKLSEHMKAHLNVRDKVCNVCGKAFTSTKYLRQHKQIHAEKKKYICKLCGKDFAQYAGLSGHMKSHGTTLIACGAGGNDGSKNEGDMD